MEPRKSSDEFNPEILFEDPWKKYPGRAHREIFRKSPGATYRVISKNSRNNS